MKLLTKSVKNSYFIISCLFFLLIQNIVIFFQHYFYKAGFRWDFDKNYYALPAFWTSGIDFGLIPQWVPFQALGYPLLLRVNAQFFYPPLWAFPLLVYSIH